jgi:hypothetical protein
MDKDTLISSFGKWAAPINSELIQEWRDFSNLDRYVKKLNMTAFLFLSMEAQLKNAKGCVRL